MIDDVLLKAIRRFWSDAEVTAAYETILAAYLNRLEKAVIITSKTTDGDAASAQVVVTSGDYREWMATLETRLDEIAATAAGESVSAPTEQVTFANRYIST